ncbi:carboxypeptidase family protein [Kordia periserrulae]|uniref:Carboxypeptidase family protein n=1 Tax=Kordia periserrulae TaxID=701523 RepID=A0A2T6BSA1_9FLAO|nr:carboxypeptidase-like regulatory domain-containing protein [Kordia periserrulae]PTX58961.1 carboxypeptidase family protein [Kordia periserrulae]
MKIQKIIAIALTVTLFFSCDEGNDPAPFAQSSISGKFLAPNNTDPIVNGLITASRQGTVISETVSATDGTFTLSNLTAGEYTISLQKGLFSAERTVAITEDENLDIPDIPIESFPRIAVVTGSFDHIESVLYDIGLVNPFTQEPLFDIINGTTLGRASGQGIFEKGHTHARGHGKNTSISKNNTNLQPNVDFSFSDLIASPTMLAEYDIIFLNCGLRENFTQFNDNLTQYVSNGGILYATDWASVYLQGITGDGQQYIDFLNPIRSGISTETEATIFDPDLIAWLQVNFGITVSNDDTILLDEFLNSWQVVESANDANVISWFNGPVTYRDASGAEVTENKDLAFTFLVGDGGVFYSSFHTENHDDDFSTVDRLLEYLVFELSAL